MGHATEDGGKGGARGRGRGRGGAVNGRWQKQQQKGGEEIECSKRELALWVLLSLLVSVLINIIRLIHP